MSANLDLRIGPMFVRENLSEKEMIYVLSTAQQIFDESTNFDETDILASEDLKKQMKKYYRYKIWIFVFEWVFIRLFLGKAEASKRSEIQQKMKKILKEISKK